MAAKSLLCLLGLALLLTPIRAFAQSSDPSSWRQPPVRIPPRGVALPKDVREGLQKRLKSLSKRFETVRDHELAADVEMLLKAVRLAIRHGEFYSPKDAKKADALLDVADQRIDELADGKPSWPRATGFVVRGYHSSIDQSAQPYGLEIPAKLDWSKKGPLYVWLHGRGDKTTDLHFLHQRLSRGGKIRPNAIVVHPFGRHCMGFKSAGEIDVLEVVAEVTAKYPVDPDRVILMGFSMGGAGAWHVGAHYADQWAAVSPGAGFAETSRYNRLTPENYPAWYEQRLWRVYDVPYYVRNLFNIPVTAYSGELDKQIQAARVMEEAYLSQGRTLPHLIGPGMGHKYHPKTLEALLKRMAEADRRGRPKAPKRVRLQTPTLRYAKQYWVEALRLQRHWNDARIDAEILEKRIRVTTKNVLAMRLTPKMKTIEAIEVDGQTLTPPNDRFGEAILIRDGARWTWPSAMPEEDQLAKRPGRQGPIDDAFLESFVVVAPTGQAANENVGKWVAFQLAHLQRRWRTLYRADLPMKKDVEITDEDLRERHLVVFGDPNSNSVLARVLKQPSAPPISWNAKTLSLGEAEYDAAAHVPALIYPNPLNPKRYLVINSGPTHREGHDRTNSLQNPKLPDWAILDIRVAPSPTAPGKVVEANFFDEAWRLRAADAR